jgi:hypothetical protein
MIKNHVIHGKTLSENYRTGVFMPPIQDSEMPKMTPTHIKTFFTGAVYTPLAYTNHMVT